MQFENYGPFAMPVDQHGDFTIGDDEASKLFFRELDAKHPGLSEGCGCYIFAMHTAGGTMPWYVGKADHTRFGTECFNDRNVKTYFNFSRDHKGRPLLYLVARMTPTGRFAKPYQNGHPDVDYVEKFLIGAALARNPRLLNVKNTALFKNLHVPGFINAVDPSYSPSTESLRKTLGLRDS